MGPVSIVLAVLLTLVAGPVVSQSEPAGAPGGTLAAAPGGDVEAAEAAVRVVPVPEPSERALRYYRSGNILWWIWVAWGLALPALLLFTGFSARLRSWARRVGRWWYPTVAVYFVLFLAVTWVLELPLAYYEGFVRQHAYDLSNQTAAKWWGDAVKELGVDMVIAVLFAWVPFLLLARSPRRWWLYTGLAMQPFILLVNLVGPIWIAPLFNEFGPMKDQELEARILGLAERAGIEGSRVFEVDKSVDTKMVNAYVSGLLGTKRIVLWDTIIAKLEPDELLFVMGHEMGHYVLGHVIRLALFVTGVILLGLYLIHRTAGGLIERFRHRFGFGELADVASVPLLILLFNVFFLLISPLVMGFSRHYEREADRFGLELTRANVPAATAFVKLHDENLANPRPGILYKLWRSGHPPVGERIDFCNTYRPWEEGGALRYGRHFAVEPRAYD